MIILMLLKLSAVVISVALGAGILARDHGLPANRLIAAFMFCNAWWAACEFFVLQSEDPAVAITFFRLMALGWVPLGVLCMHASRKLSPVAEHAFSRSTPFFYLAIGLFLPFACGTDFVFDRVERRPLGGWHPTFNLGLVVAYGLMILPLISTMASWRQLMRLPGRGGQTELASIIFVGVTTSLVLGTMTAIVVPLMGGQAMGVTTSMLAFVGVAAGSTLRRYGYSLLTPEAFAREIFDTLNDGVVVLDQDGVIRDANRAFVRMIDARHIDMLGASIRRWIPSFPTELQTLEFESFIETQAGSGPPTPIVLSPAVQIADRGHATTHAYLLRDRREVVSLQRQIAVSGRLAAVGDLSRSISESIQAPVVHAQLQLEKLAADWQTMLNWLEDSGRMERFREEVEEGTELIEECLEGVDRVIAIVQQVGSFSADARRSSFSCWRLSDVVSTALRIARVQAKPAVDVEVRLDPDVHVLMNRPEFERLVTNLIVNAFHALESAPAGSAHLAVAVGAQGGKALIHVEDDGCGIAADVLDRVFDPFFTTKPVGKGTGLGLAISYHIVKKHSGEIRVSSIEGRGTSVAVELPRHFSDVDGARADALAEDADSTLNSSE